MLFWLCVFIFALTAALVLVGKKSISWYFGGKEESVLVKFIYKNRIEIKVFGELFLWIFGSIITIMTLIVFIEYFCVNATIEKNKETYRALTYKVESNACKDDLGLLKKEVIDEVQKWNEDIIFYKTIQRDPWIGIFIPNIYDQFESIEYSECEVEE